jgi:predicted secreted protein
MRDHGKGEPSRLALQADPVIPRWSASLLTNRQHAPRFTTMSVSLGLALYFLIWWIVLFAILPLTRGQTQGEAGDVVPGTPESAPARMRIGRIILINSLVAAVMFAIVAWAMNRYLVPLATMG